jgi:L-fuconate dehydratase
VGHGRYRVPMAPGYSITMKPASIAAYAYPHGAAWRES